MRRCYRPAGARPRGFAAFDAGRRRVLPHAAAARAAARRAVRPDASSARYAIDPTSSTFTFTMSLRFHHGVRIQRTLFESEEICTSHPDERRYRHKTRRS